MTGSPVLSMQRVGRTHGTGAQRVDALVNVDLEVARGELVAVTGRSGSGKTTLLNLAGGLDEATTGSVEVEGRLLAELSRTELAELRRLRVGYVFQQFNLLPTLTAGENVSLPLELDGMSLRKARKHAETALAEVGLEDMADRYPDQLSGGEQQRVAIARGFVGPRVLLLADEPTGALDEVTSESILRLLRARCDQGAAAMLVTHEPAYAAWADRVVRIRDGRIEHISERSAVPAGVEAITP
ncbi:ABC-type antimicrobial peptide transport system, ATPase component [hydrothermal vent metagenome]|uniref:ABC-type antimicrobial peptide transport system, ATPase component n=1 Tax=hydrothermal vent metagenome TaxID=652676 RepID=A0A3B0T3C8_9ZZZZ